jgi:hypothetical protein
VTKAREDAERNNQPREYTTWANGLSAPTTAVRIVAIGLPQIAGMALIQVVAWLLVLSGALHVAFAWRFPATRQPSYGNSF